MLEASKGSPLARKILMAGLVLTLLGWPFSVGPALAGSGRGDNPPLVAVEIAALQNPSPMTAHGQSFLVYELFLTNFQAEPLTLTGIEVTDAVSGETLGRFDGGALTEMLRSAGRRGAGPDPRILQPGGRTILYLWLEFDSAAEIPAALTHTLTFAPESPGAVAPISRLPWLEVLADPPVVIGPPTHGDRWLAANGPSNTSAHRITPLVVNGHPYFAQRYAIDLIQIGPDGLSYQGDPFRNESYLCYGAPLLAVGDGVVVAVKDGIPDNTPREGTRAVPITLDTVAGNYVVIDLGSGRYADYAHLIPGSLTVKPGDRVRRGQVIGLVGNSGNSTEPHLHFHVTDGPSFTGSNGVPYAFDYVTVRSVTARGISDDDFAIEVTADPPYVGRQELVLENDLIGFD